MSASVGNHSYGDGATSESTIARMCRGVVPQQPPTRRAPDGGPHHREAREAEHLARRLRCVGTTSLTGPKPRPPCLQRIIEERHVFSSRQSRGATGTAIDSGCLDSVDKQRLSRSVSLFNGRPTSRVISYGIYFGVGHASILSVLSIPIPVSCAPIRNDSCRVGKERQRCRPTACDCVFRPTERLRIRLTQSRRRRPFLRVNLALKQPSPAAQG